MARSHIIENGLFDNCLKQILSDICNINLYSNYHVYTTFQKLTNEQRLLCWNNLSKLLEKTLQQVKDYYYNSWIKQFSPDLNQYKEEIKLLLKISQTIYAKQDIVRITTKLFVEKYKDIQFHQKSLNLYIRKLVDLQSLSV
ncbi:Conserved_hypothetical protein [Hexamita inflata]|uniref:Uncharacterized protein n=1 Tax=Hexamita inflata TaxID=28002 RepID=A0ABP1JV59_9EUKA